MGENRLMHDLYEENQRLKERIEELEEKHFNECRQIAHYSDELRRAKVLLRLALNDMNDEKDCGICEHDNDGQCPIYKESCKFEWTHAAEALALIGEDTNVPAREDGAENG